LRAAVVVVEYLPDLMVAVAAEAQEDLEQVQV
jgi:hypothetical protein